MSLRQSLRALWSTLQLSTRSMPAKRRASKLARRRAFFEPLETRVLMAADLRSLDGVGNNLANPEWGSTDEQFLRTVAAEYSDGISTPADADRPSAREVSNALAAQGDLDLTNDRNLSAFVYAWGQFLDHDIDLTNSDSTEAFDIAVPTGDPEFDPNSTGSQTIGLFRSVFDPATGTSEENVRAQLNAITSFIDGSQIYGSDAERAAALRTFKGGHLATSAGDLLPFNIPGLENATAGGPAEAYFLAGDVRANENVELTAMQTLFVREHNRVADELAAADPALTDEQLYQEARKVVIAELQAITYNEFLPALLGKNALAKYEGYDPTVNPTIANEFATAAFRFGHSMIGDDIEFFDNDGNEIRDEVELRDAFFNPQLLQETGIDSIFKYLASDRAQDIDTHVVDDLRNFLFGPPGAGGFDLAALNIQRGRDHGLADYNAVRVAYGLPAVTGFDQITSNVELQTTLAETYGDVNNIDLWVGGLAEEHVTGSSVGPLFQRIIADQFERLRDGDRFWYETQFQGQQLDELRHTSLAEVVSRNTTTTNLQDNVFIFNPQIAGRVVNDANADGRLSSREQGLGGITVQLQDATGQVIETTTTKPDGRYLFASLDLGTYRVRIVAPANARLTTSDPADIAITSGTRVGRIDFGLQLPRPKPTSPDRPKAPAPQQDSPHRGPAGGNTGGLFDPLATQSPNQRKRR